MVRLDSSRASEESCRQVRWDRARHATVLHQRWRTCAGFAVAFAFSAAAAAQTPAPPPQTPPPAPPPVVAGWNEGFFIQTPNGDNRLQIRPRRAGRRPVFARRSAPDHQHVRHAQGAADVHGPGGKYIDFKVMPELAGSVVLLDAYFDIRFSPKFRAAERQGQDAGGIRAAPRRRLLDFSRAVGRLAPRSEP